MRRSSSVRWERSGIGEATASAREAAAEVDDEAGDCVEVEVPKAVEAMQIAAAAPTAARKEEEDEEES